MAELDLDSLRAVMAQRTPGEWVVCGDDKSDIGAVAEPNFPGGILIASCNNTWLPKCKGNARAIVAAINAIGPLLERVEELEIHIAADDERERMDAEFISKLQRVLQMVRAYIDAPGQVRGALYRELVATVQAAEGLTIQAGATWAATCERLQAQLAAANERIAGLEQQLRDVVTISYQPGNPK